MNYGLEIGTLDRVQSWAVNADKLLPNVSQEKQQLHKKRKAK